LAGNTTREITKDLGNAVFSVLCGSRSVSVVFFYL